MNTADNHLNHFINELSVVNKNKFTIQQTKSLYLGLLYELIMNRNIFTKNKDLYDFLSKVFKKEYKNYLFNARPYLASRLLKDLTKEYDPAKISVNTRSIILYLEEMNKGTDKPSKKSKVSKTSREVDDDVIGWFNSIKGNKWS